jgi:hypothetical protein
MRVDVQLLARGAPLCPVGHLPHKCGDRSFTAFLLSCNNVGGRGKAMVPSISPLVGEMPDRAEGGAST